MRILTTGNSKFCPCPKPTPKVKTPYPGIPKQSAKKMQEVRENAVEKAERDLWFLQRIKESRGTCCHCMQKISNVSRENIAHILPKRHTYGFPSIATNQNNWITLCLDCHQD